MDDALVVHVLQRRSHLLSVVGRLFLGKPSFCSEVSEKTLGAVFENKVYIFGVMEEAVHFEDVGVVHIRLKFDLPKHLVHHVRFLDLTLAHNLQSI